MASLGNWQQLDKERAPGVFDPRYKGTYIHIGIGNANWDFKRPIMTPQDALEAMDQATTFAGEQISVGSEPVDIDTFYRENADTMVFTVRKEIDANLKRTQYISPRVVRVRDLPKETAWKLYKQYAAGPTTGRAYWQEFREGIGKNLEGFTAAALQAGDLGTVIEGYKRLGKLKDPEVIGKIREVMERLSKSKDPEDQRRLQYASRKILALETQGRVV